MRNFREYEVWKQSMQLVKDVYAITKLFPSSEIYALSNQLQRAVTSIPSNIAEGAGRKSDTDFAHFLDIALGSSYEVETQLLISISLGYIDEQKVQPLLTTIKRIEGELYHFINKLTGAELLRTGQSPTNRSGAATNRAKPYKPQRSCYEPG